MRVERVHKQVLKRVQEAKRYVLYIALLVGSVEGFAAPQELFYLFSSLWWCRVSLVHLYLPLAQPLVMKELYAQGSAPGLEAISQHRNSCK